MEAPNGVPIEPLVEPLSESVKYLLFDLSVSEVDVSLIEEDQLLKLQVWLARQKMICEFHCPPSMQSPGVDMSLCNLHAQSQTLGLSLLVHGISCSLATPAVVEPQRLVEVGQLEVGAVQVELSLQEPEECVPQRQRDFLWRADSASRRLWFLWSESGDSGCQPDCGCCGGCQFLDGCIIRKPLQPGVAASNRHKKPANTSALFSLRQSLQSMCVQELSCLQVLHCGLLAYYDGLAQISSSQPPPHNGSDTESFASAKASLSSESFSDAHDFYSFENATEAEVGLAHGWGGQRKMAGKGRTATSQTNLLFGLLPSYKFQALAVPVFTETPPYCKVWLFLLE